MADAARRYADNAPGDWFVDHACIDCGMCRVVAPATFGDADDHAIVIAQPPDDALRHRAGMALAACPVAAIGTADKTGLAEAARAFPDEVLPGVYLCGYADEGTYGATSWLVVRPGGNVLIDAPRPVAPLLRRIDALGGVRFMFLTHRDDVGAHDVLAKHFGAERILHRADQGGRTAGVERLVDGSDPVRLADDLLLIPVPGHTRGSVALLYRDEVLFTGDHLWARGGGWSAGGARPADGVPPLGAGRGVCWYSWPEQIRSMERLLDHRFAHVLPGHGRPWHGGHEAREPALRALVAWMRSVA